LKLFVLNYKETTYEKIYINRKKLLKHTVMVITATCRTN